MDCPRCQTPNPTHARFCLNCGWAMTRKCTSCSSDLLPGARFCMHCGHPVIETTPVDSNRFARVAAAAPETLVEKVRAASKFSGERRVVTILFVDVVASTALSERLGVQTWTAVVNQMEEEVIPIVYRYEGTIARILGDSLLAFFGAPVAHEDDPARAVRAAIDIQAIGGKIADQLASELNIEFALRACIHTGSVVIRSVREDLSYEFTSLGGAVNLTSRIKFAAQPMTTVVTNHTHRFIQPLFDCTALDPVPVKGWEQPVPVYRVDGVRDTPGPVRGIQGLSSPMVGRDAELDALSQLCEAVRAGLSRGVIVVGEPGVGKTRLVTEWKAVVAAERLNDPPTWAEGRGLSYGRGLAYHLLIDLLRDLLGIPDACDEQDTSNLLVERTRSLFGENWMEVYPYLGHLLSVELDTEAQALVNLPDPQALQTQYFRAIQRLLISMSQQRPLVMVLEDLHWADLSSVDLLIRLLPVTTSGPMLISMVTRDDRDTPGWRLVNAAREMMGGGLTELNLAPLSEDDSREMVANLLKIKNLPDQVRQVVLKKAEGNPLFVEEVIRMLIDQGGIIQENGGWAACKDFDEIEIPDNLQGLLLARIDRMPDEVKQVLRVAAVIGREFPVRVLEQILQERTL